MRRILLFIGLSVLIGCNQVSKEDAELVKKINSDKHFGIVKEKAQEIIKGGFSAGDGYGEIWIRDFNRFMNLSLDVNSKDLIREKLLIFFNFQDDNGNIPDGYTSKEKIYKGVYDYTFSESQPSFAAHKNTVETDQESSLIQGVYKYVTKSGDKDFLKTKIDAISVAKRMELALNYLLEDRYNEKHGLLYGGTTADWGDVQPENIIGIYIDENTHFSIDVYDNENMKFKPHVYINGSPFPKDINEEKIFYQGETAVAIEASLLSKEEINISIEKMIKNINTVGTGTIGLTLYPAYSDGFLKNFILTKAYTCQNGGDWT